MITELPLQMLLFREDWRTAKRNAKGRDAKGGDRKVLLAASQSQAVSCEVIVDMSMQFYLKILGHSN